MAKMGESESANKINMIGVGTTIEGSINSNENIRFDGDFYVTMLGFYRLSKKYFRGLMTLMIIP